MLTYSHKGNICIIFLCKGEIFIHKSNINTLFEIKQVQLQRQQILSRAFMSAPCNSLIKEARQLSKLNALSDTLTRYDSSLKKLTERSYALEHLPPYLPSALSDFSKQYDKLNDLSKPFAASLEQAQLFSKQNITGITKALDLTRPAIDSLSHTVLYNRNTLTDILTSRLDHINKLTEAPRLYGVANAWLASKPKLDSLLEKMDLNHFSNIIDTSATLPNWEISNDDIISLHDMYLSGEITNDDITSSIHNAIDNLKSTFANPEISPIISCMGHLLLLTVLCKIFEDCSQSILGSTLLSHFCDKYMDSTGVYMYLEYQIKKLVNKFKS